MGKSRRGDKERSREQELKYENNKLRREVSSLRKQLARIDLDRYGYVRDMIDEHLADQVEIVTTEDMLKSMKNEWKCHECNAGHLEIYPYGKMGETWYYRKCNNCPHRTKSQVYTPSVRGIVWEAPLDPEKMKFKKK